MFYFYFYVRADNHLAGGFRMEYIICDTNILDPALAEKFGTLVVDDVQQFKTGIIYKFIASFHVDLIKDRSSFESFILPIPDKVVKRKKSNDKEKIYDVLGFQLKQLENVLFKNNIEFYSSTIQGVQLESTHIIKIEIVVDEGKSKEAALIKGSNRKLGKTSSVMPSRPYTENLISEIYSERLNKLYSKLFNIIRDKKIMSEILDIDETSDDNILFQAFIKEWRIVVNNNRTRAGTFRKT